MAFSLQLAEGAGPDPRQGRQAPPTSWASATARRYPRQLSGGQRQRVAMGRAIVRDPQVFLFDEPLSNLDAKLRVQMRTEIKALHQRLMTTTIYVTHDQIEAMTMADRIVVMQGGHVEQVGAPLDLYDRPANLFVAGFIGSPAMNFLPGEGARRAFVPMTASLRPLPSPAAGRGRPPGRLRHPPGAFDRWPGRRAGRRRASCEPTGSETQVLALSADAHDCRLPRARTAEAGRDHPHQADPALGASVRRRRPERAPELKPAAATRRASGTKAMDDFTRRGSMGSAAGMAAWPPLRPCAIADRGCDRHACRSRRARRCACCGRSSSSTPTASLRPEHTEIRQGHGRAGARRLRRLRGPPPADGRRRPYRRRPGHRAGLERRSASLSGQASSI